MSFTRGARMGGFPKPGEIRGDVAGRHSREGWLHVTDHMSVNLQGKQYRDMKEWSRPCAVCGAKFSVFEKSGTVDANSRFSNRTCDAHRNLLPAVEKGYIVWSPSHGGMIAGTACVGSVAGTVPAEEAADALRKELAEAYDANAETMKTLAGLRRFANEAFGLSLLGDAINQESVMAAYSKVYGELQAYKAKYDLQPAMEAAKNNSNNFPWGS